MSQFFNNFSNNNLFGAAGKHNVTLQHLIETFGNEDPKTGALLPQLYNQRQAYSASIPVAQKEKNYYNTAIKKLQRKGTLTTTKNVVRKPQLIALNPQIKETLTLYGHLLREIFDNPSLISPIYYDPAYKYLEPIVKLLTETLLSNQFDETQEHILTSIMEDIMEFEFRATEDLTTYLRENTAATKLLGAYLKREPVAIFVNEIVEEACAFCLKNYQEDLEIDPSAIWEKEMNNLSSVVSLTGPNDAAVAAMCRERRVILKRYIDFILDKIMNPNRYPIGLRVVCKKLKELAESKDANNSRLRNSLIGGFIFLRIFNPKIAYYGKLKSQQDQYKKYAGSVRRKFTLISKILQNISNQVPGGTKEKWMSTMSDYIVGKCETVSKFFCELTNIPPLREFFALDERILCNSSKCESVYISISDLKLLTTMISDDCLKNNAKNRYHELIEEIKGKKMFRLIPDVEGILPHVVISVTAKSNKVKAKGMDKGLELNLKIKVIPVLRELWGRDALMDYLFNLKASDLVSDTINFLRFAQQTQRQNIADVRNAMNVLINYHNPSITNSKLVELYCQSNVDTQIFNRLSLEVKKMKKYQLKLEREVKHLSVDYSRILREREIAAQQIDKTKANSRLDSIFKLINKKDNPSLNNKLINKKDAENVELTENIVAVDGMIGNMLVTLVRDVGQCMATNLSLNLKVNSPKYVSLWLSFPYNVPSYLAIIQRVARLGKMCMRELISSIIEADQGNRSKDKRFKFTTLRDYFAHNEFSLQICSYVIDFMMVDMLQHCMKWISPGELYVTQMKGKFNMFHNQVNNKCIQKLRSIRHSKLGQILASAWKLRRLRKWGVLISILSPTYPEAVVDGFQLCYQNYQSDADGFLFGASYIKFNCLNGNSVPIMQSYFDWIYTLIVSSRNNAEKLKLIMLTLEHNIRALNVTHDIHQPVWTMKIERQCFMEFYKILASSKKGNRHDILHSPFRRLRSSFLLRRPGYVTDYVDEWKQWLSSLADFKLAEKKNIQKASDLLHFLRGGGSSWDQSIEGINPILEQAYGRVEPRLQLHSQFCKILCDKLFKSQRKYDRQRQSVTIFLLSASAIQLCVHNFRYAITNVIQLFTGQDRDVSIERLFIAVYALNFICLPECKFAEFIKIKIVGKNDNLAWNELSKVLTESKRKLHPQLLALFEYLQIIQNKKNLLTLEDARKEFKPQHENEKIMFEEHVHKMLLFDWTDTPLDKYMVPIQNIETELLIYCLRLAPHIFCEELWEDTELNCSQKGSFIGKWILHRDERVREQVLRTLLVAMRSPSKRSAVMQCFIEMLQNHDWQSPACLIMLLKSITHLLDHYRKLVVLDEESKKRHNIGDDIVYDKMDPLRSSPELPPWFAWQNRADALGLVLLCHYHIGVRLHALAFLNKITDIYCEFTGKTSDCSVGGLIATHGRSIARMATMKYDSNSSVNISFDQCIHQWGLIPFCISQLAKRIVNNHLHCTILNVVDVLLYTLSFMQPHIAAERDKTGWSSAQEWQQNNFLRGHWISLHTLFFSLIGAGLSNPFSISISSQSHLLKNESYRVASSQFRLYLNDFWYCLYEEALWVRDAVNSILLETNWESIPIVLTSLNATYHVAVRKKRRGKNIISDTVYLLKNLAEINKFAAGIYIGGEAIVEICFKFINDVKNQAFRADRIEKKRWWMTQIELAEFYGYFLRSLSKIGSHSELRNEFWSFDFKTDPYSLIEIRKTWLQKTRHTSTTPFAKDPMPHIKKSKTVDRFTMFKWLLQFLVDVDNIVTPFVDPQDMREQRLRTAKVRRAVFGGLQYLLNMGCVIPSHQLQQDNYIINLLRGTKGCDPSFKGISKSILQVFIEAERSSFQVLTPLLSYQFESLISFYIDKSSNNILFFKAIVNVLNSRHIRLTAVDTQTNDTNRFWQIQRPRGNGLLQSVFHYAHKLLFLGFIMIIETSADTRYSAYLLLRSMADILVGDKLCAKLDKLKFAFESSMSLWVRKNGILISEYFANSYPALGSLLFRVCIQYAEDKDRAEWISAFLKPWAKVIHLKHETSNLKHETYALLSKLFNSTVDAKEDLQTSFLKVWTDLSQAFTFENLYAILDFVLKKVQEAKEAKYRIIPTVKNIFFAIYEPPLNRAVMTVYIVRIILTVLKIGAKDYRQKGLLIKERAAAILTTLEHLNQDIKIDIHHEIIINHCVNHKIRASIAAALLVELIGVDCEPIKPYFPVLVLYAALYIDKDNHNLLTRLIVTLSTTSTIEEIEKNTHSADDNKPSLAAALTSRTLELIWDEDVKEFVHNEGDYVAIDGAAFVKEYCSQFESKYKPSLRTGYEALRWAVLSTNPEITTRSFHIYRQLLNPLNHCTVKVMLLALCGAIDNWDASINNNNHHQSISHNSHHQEYIEIMNNKSQEYIETQRILDTIIRMAEKLKEKNELYEYDSLVWTGIALLRADVKDERQRQVFKKGLELLNIVLDEHDLSLQYLFINSYSIHKIDNYHHNNKIEDRIEHKIDHKIEHNYPHHHQTRGGPNDNNNNNNNYNNNRYQHVTAGGPQLQSARHNDDFTDDEKLFTTPSGGGGGTYKHWMNDSSVDDYKQTYQTPSMGPSQTATNQADWQWDIDALDEYDFEPSDSNNDDAILFSGTTLGGPIQPMRASNDEIRHAKIYESGNSKNEVPHRQLQVYDIYSADLAESFLAYCIDWAPPFQGIHPYLLQGLLQNDIEDETFSILKKVLTTKMDKLADRSSARPCLCIVSVLPYMYYIIRHKPEYFATISHSLFESLILLTSESGGSSYNPYQRLSSSFIYWSNCPINLENAPKLLKDFCTLIVETFFAQHSGLVANYLNALLNEQRMAHHHTTVYKMAALFLNKDPNYIQAFNDIIVSAHKTLSNNNINDDDSADAATELVATGIDYLKAREKQKFTKKYQHGDYGGTTFGAQSTPNQKKEIQIRWDVYINDITPFPQTGLKDVYNALWGVVLQTRSVV